MRFPNLLTKLTRIVGTRHANMLHNAAILLIATQHLKEFFAILADKKDKKFNFYER